MTQTQTVPFRAGNLPAGEPQASQKTGALTAAITVMPGTVLMADVSEFQPDINDDIYVANFSAAIVIRAAYGARHDDHAWYGGDRRDKLHAAGIRFLGIYQYIVATQDITTQAKAFCRLIGTPRTGEYYVADIEEGSGNLAGTMDTWEAVVHAELGDAAPAAVYSGLNFAAAHGLAPVGWVAAYQRTEPVVPHLLWQFTSSMTIPGIPGQCDCSVFHGSIDQLAAHAYGGQPAPLNWTEQLMQTLTTVQQGSTGEDVKTAQGCLCARGYTTAVDGVFGPGTNSRVVAFQTSRGITADGIVGPVTWTKLHNR